MATYYIAPETGSDTNPGTSESAPRKTPPSPANGDVWLMKRGETYSRSSQWGFGAATAMTLDAYGEGGYPVVTILATANVNAFNIQGDGTNVIRNIWFKDCRTNTNGGVVGLGLITGPGYAASLEITDCKFTGVNWNAVRGGGTTTATASKSIVIRDCIFDDIGEDCFFGSAIYLEVGRCRMTNISSGSTTGDGVGFLNADPTLVWVYQNYIDHSNADTKHCVIVDTTTGAGLAVIEDNVLIGYGTETITSVDHTVVNADCQAIVRRNKFIGGGIAINLAGANSQAAGNVFEILNVRASSPVVVALQANTAQIIGNTFVGRSTLLSTAKAVTQASGASNGVVQNNIFVDVPIAIKSDNASNNPTATYNCFHNVTSPRLDQANAAFAGGNDLTVNPQLTGAYVPGNTSVRTGGTFLGGLDYYGKEFQVPPPMGAVQPQPALTTAPDRSVMLKRAEAPRS